MPMSWVKAPTGSSRRMRECMGDDTSRQQFERCVYSIVKDAGGNLEGVWYEPSTKLAHIHVRWSDLDQKQAILYDLEALDSVDLLSAEEADLLVAERELPST